MPNRPVVHVTRRLPQAVETRMAELFDVTLNADDVPLDATGLCAAVASGTVFVPTVTDEIDAAVIAAAGPDLRLIANFGAGVDHIDLRAARARGIVVTNTPGVLTDDTAEMVMALILNVSRRTGEGEKLLRAGAWTGWGPTGMLGHRIRDKTLGIVGMGRIGQAVAVRARAFGMAVQYHNRHRLPLGIEQELGVAWAPDLDAMLGTVDIVSLNCPHTPATHRLIDAAALARMKPDAYLINCARAFSAGSKAAGSGRAMSSST
jgi:glyoxylate reductase